MRTSRLPSSGVTLIELLVAVAVLAILMTAAIPSFLEFRDRAGLRGSADQMASFWGEARFEALRRNSLVKVSFEVDGTNFCLGAATTTDPADETPCGCFTAATCNVAVYPTEQSDWRGVRVADDTTLGEDSGVVVIDHKRANLTEPVDAGVFMLRSAGRSSADYRLNVAIDRSARAFICEPSAATSKLPQFTDRRC
jgi:prepilin-type N-terminal cleavage/methylation domain-containing protein